MTDDRYRAFAAGVQAMRRTAESMSPRLMGSLGVAAEPYPYQMATVKRILSSTRIRHLIADEVGMGKTVQALMILNALRRQKPGHRTVILTPPRLMDQWHKECWTRAHVKASVFGNAENPDEDLVRIISPQTILSRSSTGNEGFEQFSLDHEYYDLLVVDEPQLMPLEVMDTIQRASRGFRQVLLLSASPRLGEKDSRKRILSILEPERAILAEAENIDVDDFIEILEKKACEQIEENGIDGATAFELYASSRRIERSTREQWRQFFPERKYKAIGTEPDEADIKRIEHGLEWLKTDYDHRDRWSAAQRLHRGSRSVRAFLSGYDLSHSEAGQLANEQCRTGPGDSRLDALLDLLRTIWEDDPMEQVVIVVGDNPSIDHVSRNIQRYFDNTSESVGISTLRRQTAGANSEVDDISDMQDAMSRFMTGSDRVLLVGEWVQAGLNLHYFASSIVFYNLPWSQHAIDQLIGRLDRLRPNGLYRGEQRRRFEEICIWSIFQPDTPESRVLAGLEKLGVFLAPMPPVPPETDSDIQRCLEDLAAGQDVREALSRLEEINRTSRDRAGISRLDRYGPSITDMANQQYSEMQSTSLPEPAISLLANETFVQKSESALIGWLEFLKRSRLFSIDRRNDKNNRDIKFSTIWYTDPVRKSPPAIRLDHLEGGRWMSDHVPFISRLKDLRHPPLMKVHTDDGEPEGRPLRFLNHGDPLHDELVDKSIAYAKFTFRSTAGTGEIVRFYPENAAAKKFSGKPVLASAALTDPAETGLPVSIFRELEQKADQIIQAAPTEAQKTRLRSIVELAAEWLNADRRWLNFKLDPVFDFSAVYLENNIWKTISTADLSNLLKADVETKDAMFPRVYGQPFRLESSLVKEASDSLRNDHRSRSKAMFRDPLYALGKSVSRRIETLHIEHQDLLDVLHNNVESARRRADVDDERQRRMLTGQVEAAERVVMLARIVSSARIQWLEAAPRRLETPDPEWLGTCLFRPAIYEL